MNATLEHIWHEFAEKLGQFIRAGVPDPATAQDISQDVFLKEGGYRLTRLTE